MTIDAATDGMMTSNLLKGAVDLQVYPGPSALPRRIDHVEAAASAASAGMRAIVGKDGATNVEETRSEKGDRKHDWCETG